MESKDPLILKVSRKENIWKTLEEREVLPRAPALWKSVIKYYHLNANNQKILLAVCWDDLSTCYLDDCSDVYRSMAGTFAM
jgi:hypothetical protein